MSINLKRKDQKVSDLGKGTPNPLTSKQEIDQIVEKSLFSDNYADDDCYKKIASILFGPACDEADQKMPEAAAHMDIF